MSSRDYFDYDAESERPGVHYFPGSFKQRAARARRKKDGDGVNPAAMAAALSGDIDNAVAASTPGGIVAQEKRAVEKAVSGKTIQLAVDMLPGKEVWESLGFTFGKPDANAILVSAKMPTGWTLKPSEKDSRHIDILDEQGRSRGSMFYKAAFYDQYANMRLKSRFSVGSDYDSPNRRSRHYAYDTTNSDQRLKESEWVSARDHDLDEAARKEMCKWLDEMYPEWNNPTKHW